MKIFFAAISFIFAVYGDVAVAQNQMEEVVTTGTRAEIEVGNVPSAVSIVNESIIQTGQQQLTLEESLKRVPGVFLQNSHNFSQAQRISIRGFGARSAFGIRGIKLIVDGVPATMPDGQGNVDEIDLGSATRIEVARGPSSSLYGTASGGVINIITEDGPDDTFAEGRITIGEYGLKKYQLKAGGQYEKLNYLLSGSIVDLDGYREYSFVDRKSINSKFKYQIDDRGELTATLNVLDIPDMGDPGALREADLGGDRRSASPNNVRFNGGEERSQERLGLTYRRTLAKGHEILFKNYYTFLDFGNRLPFEGGVEESNGGQVQFDRTFVGGGGQYTYTQEILDYTLRFIAGVDVDYQRDDRQRFVNLEGGVRGDLTFDQLEEVLSMGIYMQSEFAVLENLQVTIGARYDELDFDVTDKFLANNSGDDSGNTSYDKVSPRFGLLWDAADWVNLYFNFSSAFETPTTTEFANPNGGGFNQNLRNQVANNVEVGAKGTVASKIPLDYELAIYRTEVDNELVPFEEDGFTGRTFFRNAGKSLRKGIEAGVTARLLPTISASLVYSAIDAEYKRYRTTSDNFAGNKIPGVPDQQLHAELRYDNAMGLFSVLDLLYIDSFFADDANTVESDSYAISNLQLGYKKDIENWQVTPYVSINNLFNEKYNSNVRLNGGFGRFYEPAPQRNFYGGVSARYTF
jgi:iron complex outermembrane receptor protein